MCASFALACVLLRVLGQCAIVICGMCVVLFGLVAGLGLSVFWGLYVHWYGDPDALVIDVMLPKFW